IMLNLLKNSIQATADVDVKRIEIAIQKKRRTVQITVLDSGRGLPPLNSATLSAFTPERIQGLGILYIQQQMLSSFQGSFTLEDAPTGKGCLAILKFPLTGLPRTSKRSPERQKPGRIE